MKELSQSLQLQEEKKLNGSNTGRREQQISLWRLLKPSFSSFAAEKAAEGLQTARHPQDRM